MEKDKIIIPSALTENSGSNSSENIISIPSALSVNSSYGVMPAACFTEGGTCFSQDCSVVAEGDCPSWENCSQGCAIYTENPCNDLCEYSDQDDCGNCEYSNQAAYSKPVVGTGIFASDITATSAYIYYNSIPYADSYRIAYRKSTASTAATSPPITDNPYYLSGLEPNTTYVVNYEGINDYGAGGYMSSGISFTTKSLYWSWETSNGSATDSQTQAAYYAIANNGKLTDFSYLVWNDMCDFILTVMQTKGHSWIDYIYGLTFNETLMTSDDKYMTAARFNSLRYNVGCIYSTGISEVSKGDIIYGSYFVDLMDKVNEWIDE